MKKGKKASLLFFTLAGIAMTVAVFQKRTSVSDYNLLLVDALAQTEDVSNSKKDDPRNPIIVEDDKKPGFLFEFYFCEPGDDYCEVDMIENELPESH